MPQPIRRQGYDAFLSYNHRADDRLSGLLQSALQRLAKPRNQPWAIRVFRDETDLTATPALWQGIKNALDQSRFYILLASPASAASNWVRKELCYWLTAGRFEDAVDGWAEHIDASRVFRILIVLTGGAISWDEARSDIDWNITTSLPRVLSGVFRQEPLWVVPRPDGSLPEGNNVEFMRAVARLSVPIRFGDTENLAERARELLDQDYLDYQKSNRRTRIAIFVLGALALVAIAASGFAEFQRRRAEQQRRIADEQRRVAVQQTAEAKRQTAEAERESRAALSHQLAGAAFNAEGTSTGILFALNALSVTRNVDGATLPDAEESLRRTVDAMHQASAASGTELNRPGHTSPITSFAFSSDGGRVATTGQDGVRIWDVAKGEEILHRVGCISSAFSADFKRLACLDHNFGGRFLDLETGETLMSQGCRGCRLSRMDFSPDGKLWFWEDASGTGVSDGASFNRRFSGQNAVFSTDGRMMATTSEKAVKLWEVRSGSNLQTWERGADRALFSPDGKRLAIKADKDIYMWELASGNSLPLHLLASNGKVSCLAFSLDSSRLAVLGDIWQFVDSSSGRVRFSVSGPISADMCRFGNEGNTLVVLGPGSDEARSAEVWDIESEPRRVYQATGDAVGMSADGGVIAVAHGSSARLITDYRSSAQIQLPEQDSKLQAVAFSPDATRVVTAGTDRRARVWDARSGQELLTLIGHHQPVRNATYSPDGNLIATSELNRVAKLWNAHSGVFLRDLVGNWSNRSVVPAFSADSRRVVTAGYRDRVMLWDASSGEELTPSTAVRQASMNFFAVAFSADGKHSSCRRPRRQSLG
jgi:WD40 repeat protein